MLSPLGSWPMPNCLLVSYSRWHPSHHHRPKPKPGSLRILHAHPNTGFVLPLALGTSLVLLLGSASMHSLALHGRLRARIDAQQHQRRDLLRSAAMAFAAQAAVPGQDCLLAWGSSDWDGLNRACPTADVKALRAGQVGETRWQLLDWQPNGEQAQLQLVMVASGSAAQLPLRRTDAGFQLHPGLELLPAVDVANASPDEAAP